MPRRGGTTILTSAEILSVLYSELLLVLFGYLLPHVQKFPLLHLTRLMEEHQQRHDAGEVEHIQVILNRNLKGVNISTREKSAPYT